MSFSFDDLDKLPKAIKYFYCPSCKKPSNSCLTKIYQENLPDNKNWVEVHKCIKCNTFYKLKNGNDF